MSYFRERIVFRAGKVQLPLLVIGLFVIVIVVGAGAYDIYSSGYDPLNRDQSENYIATSTASATTTGESASTTHAQTAVENTLTGPSQPSTILPQFSPGAVGHAVGIAAGGGLSKETVAALNQQLDEMQALGITWVRFDIEWGDVQYSSPNKSTWSAYDTVVNAIAAHHMNALAIILFTPQWARSPDCTGGAKCPPGNPQQYAVFAAEVAQRYRGKVQAFEVWNEPNNYAFWATQVNCAAYTTLLKTTYPAIKAVDPSAIIITGGLAPESTDKNNLSQMDFLSCIFKTGGERYLDAVGDHPYTFPMLPSGNTSNTWAQMSETSPSLRSIMVANGDGGKKIWLTEFGAPTNGPDPKWFVTEAQQSAMVTDAMNLYKTYTWAGPIFWYTLQDGGTTTSTQENFFGLIRYDGSLKPAFTALKNAISAGI